MLHSYKYEQNGIYFVPIQLKIKFRIGVRWSHLFGFQPKAHYTVRKQPVPFFVLGAGGGGGGVKC